MNVSWGWEVGSAKNFRGDPGCSGLEELGRLQRGRRLLPALLHWDGGRDQQDFGTCYWKCCSKRVQGQHVRLAPPGSGCGSEPPQHAHSESTTPGQGRALNLQVPGRVTDAGS